MNEIPSMFRPNLMPVDSLVIRPTEPATPQGARDEHVNNSIDLPSSPSEQTLHRFARQAVIFIRGKIGKKSN